MTTEKIITGAVVVIAVGFAIAAGVHNGHRRQEVAQASYDYGRKVGRVAGMCEVMQAVHDANPESVWAQSAEVNAALASCQKVLPKIAPGTRLTLPQAAKEANL